MMKKVVMTGPRTSKVVEVEKPIISNNELLVKVLYTGLCHSEWYPWSTAKAGDVFGHEPMGIVEEVGADVTGFAVGDRVSGLGQGFCEYIAMDPANTVKLPKDLEDKDGLAEPLSCIMSGAARIPIKTPGDTVAIVGAGYMGLGMLSLLKASGAGKVVVVDPRPEARALAMKLGAAEAYAPDEIPQEYILNWDTMSQDLSDTSQEIDIFKQGFDVVVEFAGTESALQLAGDMVCAHGFLGIGGYHNDGNRSIDFKLWNFKSMDMVNLHERRKDYQTHCCQNSLEMLASGQWDFKGACTHEYTLETMDEGFNAMEHKPEGYIKGIVRCSY